MSKNHKVKWKRVPQQKGKNYVQQMSEREKAFWDAGILEGQQITIDILECVLRDSKVMGKDTFGLKRIVRLVEGMADRTDYYWDAFTSHKEADVKQEELDRELGEIHGKNLIPFDERHPYIKKVTYEKARKGWVDND